MKKTSLTPSILDFWLTHNLNVLLEGRRGVGKTAMVLDCFNRNGLKWKYFSAATMDPWVDFIGIPRAVKREDGKDVLDFVMSPDFADDTIEALFFDEFNRSHKKVRDAVMELIQFKSINGRKFKNLRVVWAAINPPPKQGEDEDTEVYQVEMLDPALLDRFHIHVEVPHKPDRGFFSKKYGHFGENAVAWWNELDTKLRDMIPPRRLDYAVEIYKMGGSTAFVLPKGVNHKSFEQAVSLGSYSDKISELMNGSQKEAVKALAGNKGLSDALVHILMKKNQKMYDFFLPILTQESATLLLSKSRSAFKWYTENTEHYPWIDSMFQSIVNSGENKTLVKKILANTTIPVDTATALSAAREEMYITGSTSKRRELISKLAEIIRENKVSFKDSLQVADLAGAVHIFLNRSNAASFFYGNAGAVKAKRNIRVILRALVASGVDNVDDLVKLANTKGIHRI